MPVPEPALDERVLVPTAASMHGLGRRLAPLLRPGDLVVLSGPLGAGKTTLTQGIGAGLEVRGPVTSPTFVISRIHPALRGGPDLVHADAYRLGSRAEVDDLDLDTDLASSVTVVEWGEGLVDDLTSDVLTVTISVPPESAASPGDPDSFEATTGGIPSPESPDELRYVRITGYGARWHQAAPAARELLAAVPD